MTAPVVTADGVTFEFPDPDGSLAGVTLYQEVAWPRPGPDLARCDGYWRGRIDRPAVDRMEYLFELLHRDGRVQLVTDPANDRRAPGPFGDKSVVEFPEYAVPGWLVAPRAPTGSLLDIDHELDGVAVGRLWAPHDTARDEPLPLLLVHDGVEYARYADLTVFLDRLVADGVLPRLRAALLHPVARDEQYSASPEYAAAVASRVLPRLHELGPTPPGRRYRVAMGASLGALAALHLHRIEPASVGGLFLQSGSFFHHRHFRHELSFDHAERIRWFMDRVHAARAFDQPVRVMMTCGEVEMNFRANRALVLALRNQGYPVTFRAVPDAHTWVGWRDAFVPGLVDLLRELWA